MSYRAKANNETDILKNILKKAQDDLSVLLDEKKTLMDTVRSLQVRHVYYLMNFLLNNFVL